MSSDDLARLVQQLLGSRPSPARRREVAALLRQHAERQEQIASAEQREQQKPPEQRLGRAPSGKGGRPSTPWIRVEREARGAGTEILRIKLSRSLYYAAGSPERLDPQRRDNKLVLVPARGDAGYKVASSAGLVRITVSGARDVVGLDDGRYTAEVRAGAIVVGERLE